MTHVRWFEDFAIGLELAYGRFALTAEAIADYSSQFAPHHEPAATDGTDGTVPQMMLCTVLMRLNCDGWLNTSAGRGAPGVDTVRWHDSAHLGDVLTARLKVLDARVSSSRPEIGLVRFCYDVLANGDRPVLTQSNFVMIARRDGVGQDAARAAKTTDAVPHVVDDSEAQALPGSWTLVEPGLRVKLGRATFDPDGIVGFARRYDPQPFHIDVAAAKAGPFGALAASGWHTASAWNGAFARTCTAAGLAVPRLVAMSDLKWRRPVHAGDTLSFDLTVTRTSRDGDTPTIAIHGTGTSQHGTEVFAFDAETAV